MTARHFGIPRPQHWHDMQRDWRRWSRAERAAAPLLLAALVAATAPLLWMMAH